jgi:hypothetical protein
MNRTHPMSKSTIIRLFVAALVAVAVGTGLVSAAVWTAIASDIAVTVVLVAVGALALLAGVVAAVVSWIGALFNTWQLEDKTWFVSLAGLTLFGLAVPAMVAYVLAGPDGTSQVRAAVQA